MSDAVAIMTGALTAASPRPLTECGSGGLRARGYAEDSRTQGRCQHRANQYSDLCERRVWPLRKGLIGHEQCHGIADAAQTGPPMKLLSVMPSRCKRDARLDRKERRERDSRAACR